MTWLPPTYDDIEAAAQRIQPYVHETPLHSFPRLNDAQGMELFLKLENHQAIGCFKARGALNAILRDPATPSGVIASSSGNHGLGVAYAARTVGIPAVIVLPTWAFQHKLGALHALDAETILVGESASEVNGRARQLAEEYGYMLIDDFRDQDVISGAGTIAYEMLQRQPDLDAVVIPLGGGALAGGCGIAIKAIDPSIRTVCVQAEECPGTYLSWKAGRPVPSPCSGSIADGLAVDMPEPEIVSLLTEVIDECVLVSDDELKDAVHELVTMTGNITEPSAAAALAACAHLRPSLSERKVGLVITGSNISLELLVEILSR